MKTFLAAARARRLLATLAIVVASTVPLAPPAGPRLDTVAVADAARPPRPKRPPRDKRFHLVEATIDDIHRAIKRREITCEGLVRLYLERIKAYNGTCVEQPDGVLGFVSPIANAGQLNALMTLNLRPYNRQALGFDDRKARSLTDPLDGDIDMPDAIETAAALDHELARTGKLVGPLHCVVMAIKDQFDTFDMRTTSGMDAFYADDRPPDDATFVANLRKAGAIILAKANLGEMATPTTRSAFGGAFCNPYDTRRTPGTSSGGSGSSVGANLVTCAIGEETGGSIHHPAKNNSIVGLAATQELVTRDGMIGAGLNTRTGPMCRTVEDVARVLDVIAGYDPKDELTVYSLDRMPSEPYASFAGKQQLDGVRIGVIREHMDLSLFNEADVESVAIAEQAIEDLRSLGATIVDPGPGATLFQDCVDQYVPFYRNSVFTSQFPALFPAGMDHIPLLIDMWFDPSLVPDGATIRGLGSTSSAGQGKYMLTRYLRERGDANIETIQDLIDKASFYTDIRADAGFNDKRAALVNTQSATTLNMANLYQNRVAHQIIVLQCMARYGLDALVSTAGNIPAYVIGEPQEPSLNGRGSSVWGLLGQHGFPTLSVPAGFTTHVYDRVRDAGAPGGTKLIGPVPAVLPVAIMLWGKPFGEPTLFRIASAYEAATKRRIPPSGFGPLPGEP
jgi:amidase